MSAHSPTPDEFYEMSAQQLAEHARAPDEHIRSDAACAIGDLIRTNELELSDELGTALTKLVEEDPSPAVRFEAAIALAEGQHGSCLPVLLDAIRRRSLRLDAIRALGRSGCPEAVTPLLEFLDRFFLPWADKLQAAAALCQLGDNRGARYLKERLRSRRYAERAAAIHFMAESQHPDALHTLTALVRNPSDPHLDALVRALRLLDHPLAKTALRQARQSTQDPVLRGEIDEAIAHLGRSRKT